jgi:hypothetical protein
VPYSSAPSLANRFKLMSFRDAHWISFRRMEPERRRRYRVRHRPRRRS